MNGIAKMIREDNLVSALMDSFPCGVFVVDEQGRAQAINDTVERVLGIPEKDIIGKGSG